MWGEWLHHKVQERGDECTKARSSTWTPFPSLPIPPTFRRVFTICRQNVVQMYRVVKVESFEQIVKWSFILEKLYCSLERLEENVLLPFSMASEAHWLTVCQRLWSLAVPCKYLAWPRCVTRLSNSLSRNEIHRRHFLYYIPLDEAPLHLLRNHTLVVLYRCIVYFSQHAIQCCDVNRDATRLFIENRNSLISKLSRFFTKDVKF